MDRPLYIRGFQPPRRNRLGIAAGLVFVLTIVAVGYLTLFGEGDEAALTIEQRLAKPDDLSPMSDSDSLVLLSAQNRLIEGEVLPGEATARTLVRLGLSGEESALAVETLSQDIDLRRVQAGQKISLALQPDNRLASLQYHLNERDYLEVLPSSEEWILSQKSFPVQIQTVQFACMLGNSLYDSIVQCGEDASMTNLISRMLSSQVDFYNDIRRGDLIRISVDKEYLHGECVGYGRVNGLTYEGKVATASVFPVDVGDEVVYLDEAGKSIERPFLRAPLKYSRISSDYNLNRLHPILHKRQPHRAVDYAAPRGTPVMAVGDGKVVYRGRKGANGNLVVLDHENGFHSYYAHLSRFPKGMKVGDRVCKNSLIGFVGASGRATGPHLHYAVAHRGRFVHPKILGELPGSQMDETLLVDFWRNTSRMKTALQALPIRGAQGMRS